MLNFWIVTGQSFKGDVRRAIICEERALNWVRDEMKQHHIDVTAVPAECHWSAQVLPRQEFSDYDAKPEV